MSTETRIIEFRPKDKRTAPPMSVSLFHTRAQQYLTDIMGAHNALGDAYTLFGAGNDIWRDQCEDTITLIQMVRESVSKFCKLIDTRALLPEAVIPLRYPLVVRLHHMNKQVGDLIELVAQFRAVCRISSSQTAKQRQEIEGKLKELIESFDELRQRVCALFNQTDQMHLQKHELASF
jgi:hypothetical protein